MMSIGKKIWSFSAGQIPLLSTGSEPKFTSHDKISILNVNLRDAKIKVTVYYEDRNLVDGYELLVMSQRARKIRINDLINPLPVPLDTPYSFLLESDVPVIVQFSRMITAQRALSGIIVTPYHK
jgi:hypothetical protein